MAQEVPITGGPSQAKIREPLGVLGLSIITFGIYYLVWWFKINREMADLGRMRGVTDLGDNPTLSLLALFPGAILIVPAIWTTVTTFLRAKRAQQYVGVAPHETMSDGVYFGCYFGGLLIPFLGLVCPPYLQSGLNKVWRIDSGMVSAGDLAAAQPMAAPAAAAPVGEPVAPPPPAPPQESPAPGIIPEAPQVESTPPDPGPPTPPGT